MMVAPDEDDNSNCFFDFSLIEQIPVPGGELPSLESDFHWSSNPFHGPSNLSAGFLDSAGTPDCSKELGSRKRANTGSCSATDTKACREKRRRDKLNERFQELNEILDPGRPPKTDKMVILGDAIRRVTQLRDEAVKLKESGQDLQAKINELKGIADYADFGIRIMHDSGTILYAYIDSAYNSLTGLSDADWAGCPDDRRSTGICYLSSFKPSIMVCTKINECLSVVNKV